MDPERWLQGPSASGVAPAPTSMVLHVSSGFEGPVGVRSCGLPHSQLRVSGWAASALSGGEGLCPPADRCRLVPCVPDLAGNEYDLSGLSKVRKPWVAVDTSVDGKKGTFYLSVCTPLPYIPGCHGEFGALDSRSISLPSHPPPRTNFPARSFRQCSGILPGDREQQLEPGRGADQSSGCGQWVPEPRLCQWGQVQEPALFHQDNTRVCADVGACVAFPFPSPSEL